MTISLSESYSFVIWRRAAPGAELALAIPFGRGARAGISLRERLANLSQFMKPHAAVRGF